MDTDLFDILCNIDQCRHLIPEGSYIDLCRFFKAYTREIKSGKEESFAKTSEKAVFICDWDMYGTPYKANQGLVSHHTVWRPRHSR